ncbi:hypothetical protein WN943_006014 [Citrus x changshan-huyou]
MKDTSNPCMVVTALIATIMFAAAYTVPGGNNESGIPIFLRDLERQIIHGVCYLICTRVYFLFYFTFGVLIYPNRAIEMVSRYSSYPGVSPCDHICITTAAIVCSNVSIDVWIRDLSTC